MAAVFSRWRQMLKWDFLGLWICYRADSDEQNPIIKYIMKIFRKIWLFPERSFRDLSENVWVVALIVCRFQNNREKKHQHRRLNSWRPYPKTLFSRFCH